MRFASTLPIAFITGLLSMNGSAAPFATVGDTDGTDQVSQELFERVQLLQGLAEDGNHFRNIESVVFKRQLDSDGHQIVQVTFDFDVSTGMSPRRFIIDDSYMRDDGDGSTSVRICRCTNTSGGCSSKNCDDAASCSGSTGNCAWRGSTSPQPNQ